MFAVGRVIRWVAAIYATLVLASIEIDALDVLVLRGPEFIRPVTMSAALPLALLALGALMAADTHSSLGGVTWRRVGAIISGGVGFYGLYVIAVFTISFPNLWLAGPETLAVPSLWVGIICAVLSASVLLSISRIERRVISGQIAALVTFSATAVIFLGYVYNDVTVGRLYRPPEITFQATLVSLLIAVGIFPMRAGSGVLATAVSPGPGGRMLRRFGPAVLLIPALLLLAIETLPVADRRGAIALFSVGMGLFLLILLAVVVGVIDESSREALTSAAQAERARVGLEQEAPIVQSLADSLHLVDLAEDVELDVATRFRPGLGSVAGDASAIRALPDGSVGVVLVDMTGHGAEPAIRALRVRDLLIHSMALGRSPADAMSLVGWSAPGDMLASAVAVKIDPSTGAVSLAAAGHPPSIFVGAQEVELVDSTGPLLYLSRESEYGEVRFELTPGDTLVLMSDGIADVQRLRNGRPEPEVLADALLSEGGTATRTAELVLGFADQEPRDDQTTLVIRREL